MDTKYDDLSCFEKEEYELSLFGFAIKDFKLESELTNFIITFNFKIFYFSLRFRVFLEETS